MTATKPTIRFQTLARVLLPLLVVSTTVVHGQTPAQLPLLTKTGPTVPPNVMLTLDDSGSMAFRHMPETVFASDTFATPNPVGSNLVLWDKNDNYFAGGSIGTVPGILASGNYRLKGLRSADTNTIFYNPEITYQPWLTADGVTRLPNSGVSAALPALQHPATMAYKNPLIRTGAVGTFIDLTKRVANGTFSMGSFTVGVSYTIATTGAFTAIGAPNNLVGTTFVATGAGAGGGTATGTGGSLAGWCFANADAGCASPTVGAFVHDPGVYFRLTKTGSVYNAVTNAANYTAYSINSPGPFPKVAARTDCSGAVGPTGCSQAEERQNFANWFSYYRTRNLLARGSMMEAFGEEAAPVNAGNFVVGSTYAITSVGSTSFTAIGAASNAVDTIFTATGIGTGTGTARAIAMRLGFGRINGGSGTVDGVSTPVIENSATYGGGGVREFNRARKDNLFKWLEDLPASNSTPLVQALDTNGKYYQRIDNQGPWTDKPGPNGNIVANNKTCRRSYTFLATDGYWNGPVGTAGNADNTAGALIDNAPLSPLKTYTYLTTKVVPLLGTVPNTPYVDNWSNTLADTAMKYWKTDLQPGTVNAVPPVGDNPSFWQNMTTYTIGLGVRGTLNPATDLPLLTSGALSWPQPVANAATTVDDLWHAAVNSRGQYFSAKDPQELATAIRTALAAATSGLNKISGVVASSSTLSSSNRKYVPSVTSGSWNGDIEAFPLDSFGVAGPLAWTASSKMPLPASRNIVTFDSAGWSGTAFDWASIPASGQIALGAVAALHTTNFIDFLKGDHSKEGPGNPFRLRKDSAGNAFVLGDFVNSNPVVIGSVFDGAYTDPAFGGAGSYATFKAAKAARTPVLFIGSNDGMLHAFRDSRVSPATDGVEVFAYVPRAVYGNLEKLADKNYGTTAALQHQYFVDGPLAEADAFVPAPATVGATWRNYLFGSLGAGGRAVFALDVTNSGTLNASAVRWELSDSTPSVASPTGDPDMGYVMSAVRVGVLPNGRWVAVFGNGFGSASGKAVLYVVDIELAASSNPADRLAAVHKTVLDSTGGNGLGGVTLIHDTVTGRTSNIFVGDLKGNLWKLNYDMPSGFPPVGYPLFVADGSAPFFRATDSASLQQPITSSPAVFKGPGTPSSNGYMVVFGTGKLFSNADATNTDPQTVYSVWDKKGGANPLPESVPRPMSRADLVSRTLAETASGSNLYTSTGTAVAYSSAKRGWYMDLSTPLLGGRVVYPSQVIGFDTALVTALAPKQGSVQACDTGLGKAINLVLPIFTGTDPASPSLDTNGDGSVNGSDTGALGAGGAAGGPSAVVSSAAAAGGDRLVDVGGGGPVGDCTGDACSKTKCVTSAACGAKKCVVTIQTPTGKVLGCAKDPSAGTRLWKRIINPPIR
jgi:type IV pilus assembly protein PilY1